MPQIFGEIFGVRVKTRRRKWLWVSGNMVFIPIILASGSETDMGR
jgi:hypothetical protein